MPHSQLSFITDHKILSCKAYVTGCSSLPLWKPVVAARGRSRTTESFACFVSNIGTSNHQHHIHNSNTRRSADELTTAHAASSCFASVTVLEQPISTAPQSPDPLQWHLTWSAHRQPFYNAAHAAGRRVSRSSKALLWLARRKVTYDAVTKSLAAASVLPALMLAVQPLLEPISSTHVADAAATAAASFDWQGPLRDMFSFTVLLSVFIGSEPGAATSAAACAAGGAIALATGPSAPPAAIIATAVVLTATAVLILLCAASMRSSNKLERSSHVSSLQGRGQAVWNGAGSSLGSRLRSGDMLRNVQQALGLLGGGLLFQFLRTACHQATSGSAAAATSGAWLPQVAAGAAAATLAGQLLAPYKRSKQVQEFCEDWPAWSATLLLILQPLQQLVMSAMSPLELLSACSAGQQLLLVFACGLMVPRALLLGELMWFTGTSSGAMLAAAQLVVLEVKKVTNDVAASAVAMVVAVLVTMFLLKVGWGKIAQGPRALTTAA